MVWPPPLSFIVKFIGKYSELVVSIRLGYLITNEFFVSIPYGLIMG